MNNEQEAEHYEDDLETFEQNQVAADIEAELADDGPIDDDDVFDTVVDADEF